MRNTIVTIWLGRSETHQPTGMKASRCCVAPPPRSTRSPPSRDSYVSSTSVSGEGLLGFGGDAGAHISAIFRPTIEQVARATEGETVDLSVLRGQRMWFVDQIESSYRLRAVSAIGVRFPLDGTANGKAALAALDDADAEAALSRLSPDVADGLLREIAEIRRTGIAFDRGEHTPGISAAAIAQRAVGDNVIAISVPAPTERFLEKEQRIVSALRAAADSPAWTR